MDSSATERPDISKIQGVIRVSIVGRWFLTFWLKLKSKRLIRKDYDKDTLLFSKIKNRSNTINYTN